MKPQTKKLLKILTISAIVSLLFVGILMCLPSSAAVVEGECGENLTWSLDTSTGVLTISGSGDMTDYSSGGAPWYVYRTKITSVVFSGEVTIIGNYTFADCSNLTSVSIPNSVTWICLSAFDGCSKLTEIEIPNSVKDLDYYSFGYCTGLTSVVIPDSVTWMDAAFIGCTNLKSVHIGSGVVGRYNSFFDGCNLDTVTVSEENSRYYVADNCLIDRETKTLVAGTNNSIIPQDGSVTKIEGSAFSGRKNLTKVIIPNSITSIRDRAFSNCVGLTSVEIPDSVISIGGYAFYGCTGITEIVIPDSVETLGNDAFRECTNLSSVTLGNGITTIAYNTFLECSSLRSIEIPDSVKTIGEYAFWLCYSLESVTFGNSVQSIGARAFEVCDKLTSIEIPDSVLTIEESAFNRCSSLKTLSLGSGLFMIGECAFEGCNLDTVTVSAENVDYSCVDNCVIENLTDTLVIGTNNSVIPSDGSVTSIAPYAFSGRTGLSEITIPESVTSIGDDAFYNCRNLKKVYNYSDLDIVAGSDTHGYVAYYADTVITYYDLSGTYTVVGDETVTTYIQLIPDGETTQTHEINVTGNTGTYAINGILPGTYTLKIFQESNIANTYTVTISDADTVQDIELVIDPYDETLKFKSAVLTLYNNLALKYNVDKTVFADKGYTNPYVVFEFNGKQITVDTYTETDTYYVFVFSNIYAYQMNDTIYATLYAEKYNNAVYGDTVEYSVATYCYSRIEKSTDEKMKTLAVDILNYGAASQVYFNYKTDDLANAELTEEQRLLATDDRTLSSVTNPQYSTIDSPSVKWRSANLSLQNSICIKFRIETSDVSGMTLKVKNGVGGNVWEIISDQFVSNGDGTWYINFSGLMATQLSTPIYVTVYKDSVAVSDTLRYSVESYAYSKHDSTTPGLADLIRCIVRYGDSAAEYFIVSN